VEVGQEGGEAPESARNPGLEAQFGQIEAGLDSFDYTGNQARVSGVKAKAVAVHDEKSGKIEADLEGMNAFRGQVSTTLSMLTGSGSPLSEGQFHMWGELGSAGSLESAADFASAYGDFFSSAQSTNSAHMADFTTLHENIGKIYASYAERDHVSAGAFGLIGLELSGSPSLIVNGNATTSVDWNNRQLSNDGAGISVDASERRVSGQSQEPSLSGSEPPPDDGVAPSDAL
jgi:hypothetical protein